MKDILKKTLNKLGYSLQKVDVSKDIKEKEFWEIYNACKPYTMTSIERMYGLYGAVKYIIENDLKGDFVECGVWKGGSSMLIAQMLKKRDVTDRKIYLYDTFEGMSEPTELDFSYDNESAKGQLDSSSKENQDSVWCYASLGEVESNMRRTLYPIENIVPIKGKVEDTIPNQFHSNGIALLRLDTDWYESTRHELIHLYPSLVIKGVIIIDDYGHWEGCRKAVDEYFDEKKIKILLSRLDYTGRIGVKM